MNKQEAKEYTGTIKEINVTNVCLFVQGKRWYISHTLLKGDFKEGDRVKMMVTEDDFILSIEKVE